MSQAVITVLFLFGAIIMFIWEKIPVALTSMIVCVGLILTGVLTPDEAFAGFVDSSVIIYVPMFIIGCAFFDTGMAEKVGAVVTRFAKTERMTTVAVMSVTGLMSGFLSNTGTVAVLLPVVIGIVARSGYARSRLLLPLVYAATMGGNLSLIGSPGNMIAQSVLQHSLGLSFGFFEYACTGLPLLICGILYFAFLGHKFLPDPSKCVPAETIYDEKKADDDVPQWKQYASLIILIFTVLAMIFEDRIGIRLYVSGCVGAIILVLGGIISEKQAYKSIDMRVIFLASGTLALAKALEKSGGSQIIVDAVIGALGHNPSPLFLTFVVFVTACILTNFMSNTVTTALLAPVAISIATRIGADPKAVLMATVIGGSCAFASPIGTAPNAMVLSAGGYHFKDYLKAGLPLILIAIIVNMILLPVFFPFFPG